MIEGRGFTPTPLCPTIQGMARCETSLSRTLLCIIGMRHTLMLPGIDAEMREFGKWESGKREFERKRALLSLLRTLPTAS
jgi:hypothetical protein